MSADYRMIDTPGISVWNALVSSKPFMKGMFRSVMARLGLSFCLDERIAAVLG